MINDNERSPEQRLSFYAAKWPIAKIPTPNLNKSFKNLAAYISQLSPLPAQNYLPKITCPKLPSQNFSNFSLRLKPQPAKVFKLVF